MLSDARARHLYGSGNYIPESREIMPDDMSGDRMLKWFEYEHLPETLKSTSRMFFSLASELCNGIAIGPERTVALRKLLEAKDAAVRAKLHPGG